MNGRRILFARPDGMLEERRRMAGAVPPGTVEPARNLGTYRVPRSQDPALVMSPDVVYTLARIRPEHVAAIEMKDCRDMSLGRIGGEDAIFVSLKAGVHYEDDVGSVVTSVAAQDSLLARIMQAPVRTPAATVYSRPFGRLLGIFDFDSGQPVTEAVVIDLATGSRVLSTARAF